MQSCTNSKSFRRALTRIEIFAVLIVVAVLGFVAYEAFRPRRYICREVSTRLVCASNLKGIATSCKIYANNNGGNWPSPAFDEDLVGKIDYRIPVGAGVGTVQSPNRSQPSFSGPQGTRELTVSRAYWILVRSGDITAKQFICPQSGDVNDPTENLDRNYDFTAQNNLSYGFQVPFGPVSTRAREGLENRMIVAADKGPYKDVTMAIPPVDIKHQAESEYAQTNRLPTIWKSYNSQNHSGEGQNLLFADGHIEFKRTPIVGIDEDNIYTIMLENFNEASRTSGESPWMRASPPYSSTDSVIFP